MAKQDFQLESLSLGQLLDRTFRLYRSNLATFIGIVAVVQIPTILLNSLSAFGFSNYLDVFSNPSQDPNVLLEQFTDPLLWLGVMGSFLITFVTLFLNYLSLGALARAVAMRYLGEEIGVAEAYRQMLRSWKSLIGMGILAILLAMVIFFSAVPFIIGLCSFIGMFVFLGSAIQFAIPAIVLEGQSASGSLRRAWDLMRRRFWQVALFAIILYILQQVILVGPASILQVIVTTLVGGPTASTLIPTLVSTIATGLIGIVYLPLNFIAITLYYIDLRVKTEGLDLALKANESSEMFTISDLLQNAPKPEKSGILTFEEYISFVGLSIGFFVIAFAISLVFSLIGVAGLLSSL